MKQSNYKLTDLLHLRVLDLSCGSIRGLTFSANTNTQVSIARKANTKPSIIPIIYPVDESPLLFVVTFVTSTGDIAGSFIDGIGVGGPVLKHLPSTGEYRKAKV